MNFIKTRFAAVRQFVADIKNIGKMRVELDTIRRRQVDDLENRIEELQAELDEVRTGIFSEDEVLDIMELNVQGHVEGVFESVFDASAMLADLVNCRDFDEAVGNCVEETLEALIDRITDEVVNSPSFHASMEYSSAVTLVKLFEKAAASIDC